MRKILDTTEISLWDVTLRDALIDLSDTMFARQRNLLIYDVSHWPFDDLAGPTCLTLIPAKYPGAISADDFTTTSSYFSVASAITLIRFGLKMLDDIAAHTVAFQPIPAQFRKLLSEPDADAITRMSR